jgi:hypothetical protein
VIQGLYKEELVLMGHPNNKEIPQRILGPDHGFLVSSRVVWKTSAKPSSSLVMVEVSQGFRVKMEGTRWVKYSTTSYFADHGYTVAVTTGGSLLLPVSKGSVFDMLGYDRRRRVE